MSASIIASPSFWFDQLKGVAPFAFILGLFLFVVLAPIHGALGRWFDKPGNDAIKMIFGGLAALSLVIAVAGLVGMTS